MKKVLLVNSNMEIMPYPVAPLGLSLVANTIKDYYSVEVFDCAFQDVSELEEKISEFAPDYIGISIRNIDNVTMGEYKFYLEEIKETVVDPIKQISKCPIIIGGSAFSIAPAEVFQFIDVDYGVVGEAEGAFLELLRCLDNGEDISLLENIISRDGYLKINKSKEDTLILPYSEFDRFFDPKNYLVRGSYPLQTKRGCSYKCIYCSYPTIEGDKYRLRNPKDIADEMESVLKRLPNITFEFVDSTFNAPLDHAIKICDEIIKKGIKTKIRTMGVNPGYVTSELIKKMKKAGFSQIDCTPESASSIVVNKLKKNFTINKLEECARLLKEHDMPTMWFFMFGAPGETLDTIKETFDFIDQHIYKNDMVHITEGIRIFKGTELFDIAVDEGIIKKDISVMEKAFYVSPSINKDEMHAVLLNEISRRSNVVHADNSTPNKDLLGMAIAERKAKGLDEPMFRTLLRIQNNM